MTVSSRSLTFTGNERGFLLDDLRELVKETQALPGDVQVSVVVGSWNADGGSNSYAVVTWKDGKDGPVKVIT